MKLRKCGDTIIIYKTSAMGPTEVNIMEQAIVRSSNGDIYIDYLTGEVKHIEYDGDAFKNHVITKFDLPKGDLCAEYDILDLGYWRDNGEYDTSTMCYICGSHDSKRLTPLWAGGRGICDLCYEGWMALLPLSPGLGASSGPYYYKILKTTGQPRFVESRPKGPFIVEYIETIDNCGQERMHYLTLIVNSKIRYACDYRSCCGCMSVIEFV